jgi:acyl carrier protein
MLFESYEGNNMIHQSDLTERDIEDWCCKYLAQVLRRAPESIDCHADFDSLGIDSAESVFLVAALETWSGVQLSPEAAIEHPTVTELSQFVFRTNVKGVWANPGC